MSLDDFMFHSEVLMISDLIQTMTPLTGEKMKTDMMRMAIMLTGENAIIVRSYS